MPKFFGETELEYQARRKLRREVARDLVDAYGDQGRTILGQRDRYEERANDAGQPSLVDRIAEHETQR